MSDDQRAEDRANLALQRLRHTITTGAVPPPAAALRRHVRRRVHARRATAGGLAAVAVAAVAVSGGLLERPTAGQPPAASGGIDQVDWTTATIDLPPLDGCPSGLVEFVPEAEFEAPRDEINREEWEYADAIAPPAGFPAVALYPYMPPAFGDLTGDGEPEAVLSALCHPTARDHGFQRLLVVGSGPDGELTGLGWVTPATDPPAQVWVDFRGYWVTGDGRLLIDAAQHSYPEPPPDGGLAYPPGYALSYRWDGQRLVDEGPAAEYSPVLTEDGQTAGPPVRLGPVADGLGCFDAELRFTLSATTSLPALPDADFSGSGEAEAGGHTYQLRPNGHRLDLFDLDGSGERKLLVAIECDRTAGGRAEGLAVFEPAGDGWQGVAVLPSPTEPSQHYLERWLQAGQDLTLSWSYERCAGCDHNLSAEQRYRWTGDELVPVGDRLGD
jgi:hypothetical protein